MIVPATHISSFIADKPHTFAGKASPHPKPQAVPLPSSRVSISVEARQTAEKPSETTDEIYKLEGRRAAVLGNAQGLSPSPHLQRELDKRIEEESLRDKMNFQYASEHRFQTVGQIYVDGKLFAEVNESGGFASVRQLNGLRQGDLSPETRIQDIARVLKGTGRVEIKYSDFGPGIGGWSGPNAPEHLPPPFTARSRQEIHDEMMELFAQQKSSRHPAPRDPVYIELDGQNSLRST